MKKKALVAMAIAVVISVVSVGTVFAADPATGDTKGTTVSYEAAATEWTWSVPASQAFTSDALSLTGNVAIAPATEGGVITLDAGTKITVSIASANSFALKCGTTSSIPYTVSANSATLAQNAEVLAFTAGTSANTGVSNTLTFATTAENIATAKTSGQHSDTLTFTITITPGA